MGKTKCKVLFAAVLCLIVSLGLLTGCGSKPKDAKELVDFSTEAMKKVESAHVDVDGSFDIGMNFEGATSKEYEDYSKMDIPIDMNGSFDASKEVLAGNYDLSLFVMGFDETISSEVSSISVILNVVSGRTVPSSSSTLFIIIFLSTSL